MNDKEGTAGVQPGSVLTFHIFLGSGLTFHPNLLRSVLRSFWPVDAE